jgi:nicotinate-nucleotide--dimethylbenzimidazole phosphoribosyltransferase
MPEEILSATVRAIRPVSQEHAATAGARAADLAVPPGSLGRLLDLSVRLAAIQRTLRPTFPRKAVVVMAGDHGVVHQGVSAFPAEVTPQMVANFVAGRAAINALAGAAGARVLVVDVGVAADLSGLTGSGAVIDRKVRLGTMDLSQGAAMTREQAVASIAAGIGVVESALENGLDLLGTGDMGIGNTTPSTCLACVFTAHTPAEVTGRGTGIDDEALRRKTAVVAQALERNSPDPADPLGTLAKVGGLEIGGIAGVMLGGARAGLPVLVDGFISTAAALVACALAPDTRDYLVAAHRSQEPGHRIMLEHLGLTPLLDLDLRLGEGTGAALAMPLVDGAAALLREMATFAEAGVTEGGGGRP